MERWGQLLFRLGTAVWLGTIFFLFFGVATVVFKVIPMPYSGRLVDAVFPIYYGIGFVFGGLLLLGALLRLGTQRLLSGYILSAVGVVNLLLVWWADVVLRRMNHVAAGSAPFRAWHQESVVISIAIFLVVLFGLVFEALAT